MSGLGQRPEHLLIRDYITELRDQKRITRERLRDLFVPVYLEMIPPSDETPTFEAVHRHDSVDQMRRKDDANLKKLWRAIDGATFFPLAFRAPLIAALERHGNGVGVELEKRLMHNAGLYHMPIDTSGKAPVIYAEWLQEFSEANSQLIQDMNDDGAINSERTRKEVLDVIEKSLQVLRELERNVES